MKRIIEAIAEHPDIEDTVIVFAQDGVDVPAWLSALTHLPFGMAFDEPITHFNAVVCVFPARNRFEAAQWLLSRDEVTYLATNNLFKPALIPQMEIVK